MEIAVKKTTELTSEEISQICDLFNNVFEDHHTDPQSFLRTYSRTPVGYSLHSIMKNDGQIVGVHNNIPYYYYFDNRKYLFAYGGGTMVLKQYRDFFSFRKLYLASEKYARDNGIAFLFGFPNENSHTVFVKGFGHKDMSRLKIYALPLRLESFRPSLKVLNPFVHLLSLCMIFFSEISRSKKQILPLVRKDPDTFYSSRFQSSGYRYIQKNDYKAIYKISVQNGIKTAFLLDVYPMSIYSFDSAVRNIFRKVRNEGVELIMYVGNLSFSPKSMLKIPHKYEPKKFHFTGLILNTEEVDDRIYETDNWEVGLANYDLI